MPDVPVAELLQGDADWGGRREELVESDRGAKGVRWYKVNTEDPDAALLAFGMPRRGHRWSPSRSNLRVVNRTPVYIAGQNDSVTGVGGFTGVEVQYETPGFSGRIVPRVIGGAEDYTEYTWETGTARVYYDARVDVDPVTFGVKVDNGRGFDKGFGKLVAVVHRFRSASTPTPNALVSQAFAKPINSQPLTLPPEQGAGTTQTVAALEAKFVGFERRLAPVVADGSDDAGMGAEFVIRLELAPVFSPQGGISGHDVFWQQEGPDGSPVASRINQADLRSDYRTLVNA